MTKKEIRNNINKAVYIFAESLGYMVSDDNDGAYVTFSKPDRDSSDDTIDYMRSYHETCTLNWASDKTKADAELIQAYAMNQKRKYDNQ